MERNRPSYPFIWLQGRGWWFKMFGEVFGPYERARDARFSLALARYLRERDLERRSRPARL